MSAATSTLGGSASTKLHVTIPAWGRAWADVSLAEPVALTGAQTLVAAGVSMRVSIVAGGVYEGRASYRVVAGEGGWSRSLRARGYMNDLGVRVGTILDAAATEVGERVAGYGANARVGSHFAVSSSGPASSLLNGLFPRGWYVDLDGVTQIGQRPTTTFSGTAPRTRVDPAGQIIELATDSAAGLLPGVVVDGSAPASDIEIIATAERTTVRVYAGAVQSRRLSALARIVEALDPWRKFRGVEEFRVVGQSGERLHLQPVRTISGLPDLENVPVRPGMSGMRAQMTLGALVLVAFPGGDPSRPNVISHDDPDSAGWMPLFLKLGAEPTLGIARITDTVQAGAFAGVITGASTHFKAGV